ncbi:MAG: histidine triad nucleotide-binding protein [Pseudomonadota bacterium]
MPADCLFCGIVAGTTDAAIVYSDEAVVAFEDINPQAPHHVLFIPRHHVSTLNDANDETVGHFGNLLKAAAAYAAEIGVAEDGYRVVMNCNSAAGQTVFHVHLHFLAGRSLSWPPG